RRARGGKQIHATAHERGTVGDQKPVAVLAEVDDRPACRERRRDTADAREKLADRDRPTAREQNGSRRRGRVDQWRVHGVAHQLARFMTSDVLTPPNAKLLLITCSTSSGRPSPAT